MPHVAIPNFRQQQALDAIDRAATDFDIAIRTYAPKTDAVSQAHRTLAVLTEALKTAILTNDRA